MYATLLITFLHSIRKVDSEEDRVNNNSIYYSILSDGVGLFAASDIKVGTCLGEYAGHGESRSAKVMVINCLLLSDYSW
jgi:hypothetical protein